MRKGNIIYVAHELELIMAGLSGTHGITADMLDRIEEEIYETDDDEFEVCDALEKYWKPYDGQAWWNVHGEVMEAFACRSLLAHGYDRMFENYFEGVMNGACWMCYTLSDVDGTCGGVVEGDGYEDPDDYETNAA